MSDSKSFWFRPASGKSAEVKPIISSSVRKLEFERCCYGSANGFSISVLSDLGQHTGQVKEVFLGEFICLRIWVRNQTRELIRVGNSLPVRFDRKQSLYPEDRCIPGASRDGQ